MKPAAVVIGDMDLVRPLGMAGITCIAAGPTGTETRWSRYCRGSVTLPNLWSDPHGAVDVLVDFARNQSVKPVLFYQKDPSLLMLSRFRDVLARWFDFVVPDANIVEDLVDKDRFSRRALDLGLAVPDTIIARPGIDAPPVAALPFPVIVKPVLRSRPLETWRPIAGGAKAVLCTGRHDLDRLWARTEVQGVPLTIQEYIPGDGLASSATTHSLTTQARWWESSAVGRSGPCPSSLVSPPLLKSPISREFGRWVWRFSDRLISPGWRKSISKRPPTVISTSWR